MCCRSGIGDLIGVPVRFSQVITKNLDAVVPMHGTQQ